MNRSVSDRVKREVKYVNKDFAEYRQALINHAKTYFPNTYSDFNETSPGMMFVEMASYVGDVLSMYADTQLQESFLYHVNERKNLYNLAQGMGYKVKTLVPAQVDLDIMQLVPSIGSGENTRPDFTYGLVVQAGMQCSTEDNVVFRTVNSVDFRFSSSYDPTEVTVHSISQDGTIDFYLLKKCVKAVEGEIQSHDYAFGDAKIYDKIVLPDTNIGDIIDIVDSDSNTWYEVPFLAQDLVPITLKNTPYNDPKLAQYRSSVPYLLCYRLTERRFITKVRKDDRFEIQFGAGLSQESNEEIVPSPYNVGIGLDYFRRVEDISIDPMNFLYTKTYGRAPSNTTLTVRYSTCRGIEGNVKSNSITRINVKEVDDPIETVNPTVLQEIKDSISVNNPYAAYGGLNKKSMDVIREEAMANFAAQNRSVTKEDYILRCFTMPAKYGSVSKAYIEQDTQINQWNTVERIANPFSLNLYVLSYNNNNQLVAANEAIKENLRQYLRQYRLMTDAINIKDPFIINIGMNVDIIVRPNYNSNEVSLRCLDRLKELLHPDKLEINAPIMINNLMVELDKLEGVQTVQEIEIFNLYDTNLGYSGNVYDVESAIRNNVVYPSLDPCIFEVRYPNRDLKVRVIDL